jgi:CrcB protein
MQPYLLVFLGAGFGGAFRLGGNVAAARLIGTGFPWGTLTVNVVGGFAMGVIAEWLALKGGAGWTQHLRLFATTGILGGFTTFSAFSLDAVLIWERGQLGLALVYVLLSVALSIAGLIGGLALIRALA